MHANTRIKNTMTKEVIKRFPRNMGAEVQYYYRRGNVLYFRTLDKTKTISIVIAPELLKETLFNLKFGSIYRCVH